MFSRLVFRRSSSGHIANLSPARVSDPCRRNSHHAPVSCCNIEGTGSITGALGGVVLFAMISNSFNLLGIEVWYQQLIKGLIVLVAGSLYIDRARRTVGTTTSTQGKDSCHGYDR